MWRVLKFHEPALVPNSLHNGYPIFSLFPGDYLANRFYVAVRLFINRSEMMSKCVKMRLGGGGSDKTKKQNKKYGSKTDKRKKIV